jgi:phosphatidylglycerol:prolipoprotein diacylglycerol transferase|tara:strand:- start:277 stop:1050 length:774 start_codon:yes stop_codon:yes gene_type:complete
MFINNFDPVAIQIFSIEIRWYSLAYIFGILIGWLYCKKILIKDKNISKLFDDLISYLIIGIILGGRLGYVIFYNLEYFLSNPIEILMIWHGGMSFHGGLLGVLASTIIYAKKHNVNKFIFLDLIAGSAPIGIFLGRIANFVNSELYGRETNILWSVIFTKIDNITRHPSQIYEALLEGVILFFILFFFIKKNYLLKPGLISSLFLIFYSLFRFLVEFFRVPDEQVGLIYLNLTIGQIISLIFLSFGFYLFFIKKNEN